MNLSKIKCIVYTDKFDLNKLNKLNKLNIFKAYNKVILDKFNTKKYYGIAIIFYGTKENIESINKYIGKVYINIYIKKIPNQNALNYIKKIIIKYNKYISFTKD